MKDKWNEKKNNTNKKKKEKIVYCHFGNNSASSSFSNVNDFISDFKYITEKKNVFHLNSF